MKDNDCRVSEEEGVSTTEEEVVRAQIFWAENSAKNTVRQKVEPARRASPFCWRAKILFFQRSTRSTPTTFYLVPIAYYYATGMR